MKKLFILIAFVSFGYANEISAQFQFGAGVNIPLEATQLGVQGRALYSFTEQIRANGAFTFYLGDSRSYGLDFDVHYKLVDGESFVLSPFAGFNITSIDTGFLGNVSNSSLQFGAFFEIPMGGMNIYAEPKFILDGSSLVVSAGVLF